MTRQAWFALYDDLESANKNGDIASVITFLGLLLIELKPEVPIKHTQANYADEPPF